MQGEKHDQLEEQESEESVELEQLLKYTDHQRDSLDSEEGRRTPSSAGHSKNRRGYTDEWDEDPMDLGLQDGIRSG